MCGRRLFVALLASGWIVVEGAAAQTAPGSTAWRTTVTPAPSTGVGAAAPLSQASRFSRRESPGLLGVPRAYLGGVDAPAPGDDVDARRFHTDQKRGAQPSTVAGVEMRIGRRLHSFTEYHVDEPSSRPLRRHGIEHQLRLGVRKRF